MDDLGYGAGYKPTEFGYEKTVKERMEWWEKLKKEAQRKE